jgi:predicted Zn finger-like uncharacterized protein
MNYRAIIIQELEKILGYNFSEEELSPDTRKKIGDLGNYYAKLIEVSEKIKSIKIIKNNYEKYIGFTIFLIILFLIPIVTIIFSVLLLLILIYLIRKYSRIKNNLKVEKNNYNNIYTEYYTKLRELAANIHEELKEIYRLRLRPERVEYRVDISYSIDKGIPKLECPNCKANIPIDKSKIASGVYKCDYCGKPFLLPKKILDLL